MRLLNNMTRSIYRRCINRSNQLFLTVHEHNNTTARLVMTGTQLVSELNTLILFQLGTCLLCILPIMQGSDFYQINNTSAIGHERV